MAPLTRLIGFVATRDAARARNFYEHVLKLSFVADDQFALVFRCGVPNGATIRVVRVESYTPAPFTILGWESVRIEEDVRELRDRGVVFERFGFFEQDELGIWTAPNGAKVAWFKDPDGNTLSLSQHE